MPTPMFPSPMNPILRLSTFTPLARQGLARPGGGLKSAGQIVAAY